ncbi:hypothetical protein [Arachnia propionica]|uniref:Uncharacterized protein n=1 Tax=Arachnia propionica TaxID=1750 RepID=A0A3P1WYN2_9ACTN|nr:hypothetical protein [Arachnia propionica]RRD50520.1 hypothetical protein EII35_03725 [Arachnia propionica]
MSEHPSLEVLVDQARDAAALTQEEAQRWFHHMEAALEALEQAPPEDVLRRLEAVTSWKVLSIACQAWPDEPRRALEWRRKLHRLYWEAVQRVTPQQQDQQQRQMRADEARHRMHHDDYYHHHETGHSRGIGL